MMKIYNPNGVLTGIIESITPTLERELSLPPTLLFDLDFEQAKLVQLEGIIETEVGNFIVKEKKKGGSIYSFVCKPDFGALQSELINHDFRTVTAEYMLGKILGTQSGWTYQVTGAEKRSLKIEDRNKYDSIFAVADTFYYEIYFDTELKKIIMRDTIGKNTGDVYIHDEVNLVNLSLTADSYDIYTRIYPRGKDGMGIADINGGKAYIDNFQYTDKVKPLIWEDERYTVAENLKEDAIKKLMDLSKPRQSYEVDIVDLYKLDETEWSFLKLEVGDFINLVSQADDVDVKQRIVKKVTELNGDGTNDQITIANLSRDYTNENSEDNKLLKEAMQLVEETIREAEESLNADYNDKFKAIGDMITGENGGYKIDRFNELGQVYETLYMDNTDIEKAVNVIRLNKSGIAFSTNGVDGPYNLAMTIDGQIAGKYVIVDALETITANLGTVTAGRVQSADNSSWWDLNTGEVNLNASSLKLDGQEIPTVEQVEAKFSIMDGEISQKIVTEVTETINEIGIPEDGYTPIKGIDYFDGKDGADGKDGRDGTDGKSNYLHIRYSKNADGSSPSTDPLGAVYIGVAVTESAGSPPASAYKWSLIKGKDGIEGEDGKDGQTSYLHIKYSDDGKKFTANNGETVGAYIGTYVDFTKEDSMEFSKYTWNKVRGDDGYTPVKGVDYFDGVAGRDGKDGTSKFLHIRYSQNADGSGATTNPAGAKYIGVAVTESSSPPASGGYNWTLIKGDDGIQGEKGPKGETSYLHIKYSNDGKNFTANNGETVGAYIGTYVDFVKEDSSDFSRYTWNKVRGDDGYTPVKGLDYFDGKDGRDGKDGTSKYLYVRYSKNADGSGATTNPAGALYIGIAVTDTNIPPTNSAYNWTLIKGTDGVRGEQGPKGETSYLHIKYSDDGKTFTANNGETVGKWIGTYVDFIKDDSNDFSKYTWNKVRGEDGYTPVKGLDYFDGIDGNDGKDGKDGTSKFLHIRYSQTETGANATTNPAGAKYIGIAVTDTNNPPANSAYNWTLIKGTDGIQGERGPKGETSYLHIKYSNNGATFTANNGETVGEWIGTYVDFIKEDSMNFNDYTWNKIVGRSIEKVEVEYAQTTSPTSTAGATWSTTAPTWIDGRYIWSRTKTTYSSGSPTTTQAVMITGSAGKDGGTGPRGPEGAKGRGITSIRAQYYQSTSKTGQSGGSWSYTQPVINTSRYMWTRNEVIWNNPTETTWTTPILSEEVEQMKNVIQRVITVENNTTKDKIVGYVRDETTIDGKPLFAKTSEVAQTVDAWTAKFSEIGGRNMIRDSENINFQSWENSSVIITRNISVPAWGATNAIRVHATSGDQLSTLKAYSSLYTNHDELRGKTYTLSFYARNDRSDASVTLKSLRFGEETLGPREMKRIVITGNTTRDASVQIQIHSPGPTYYAEVTIWHPQLEAGEIATDWRPHPNEIYEGITRIDKDGVTVGRGTETVETNIDYDGMRIRDGRNEIASFLGGGAVIQNLEADTIRGDVVNVLRNSVTLNVGPNAGYFANVDEALASIGDAKFLAPNVVLEINIYGTHDGFVLIHGFMGAGEVLVNLRGRIHGGFRSYGNTCQVKLLGVGSNRVVKFSGNAIISSSDTVLWVENIITDSENNPTGRGIIAMAGTTVYVRNCDFANNNAGIHAQEGAVVHVWGARGDSARWAFIAEGGRIFANGMIPKGGSNPYGFVYFIGTNTPTSSAYSPPASVTTTETRTFNATNIWTYSTEWGAKSTHYGRAAAQNRWSTNIKHMKGRIEFGSAIYNFINGRDRGTTPTVRMRLRRQNSTHGASASVAPTPEWTGAPSFSGATRGNWTGWTTIPYTLFGSSGYTFSFYDGSTGNRYAIWDRAEIEVTRRITQ